MISRFGDFITDDLRTIFNLQHLTTDCCKEKHELTIATKTDLTFMSQAMSQLPSMVKQNLGKPGTVILARNLIVVVLLVWACFNLATLFWALFPTPDVPETSSATPRNAVIEAKTGSGGQSGIDIGSLVSAELFGPIDPTEAVAEPVPIESELIRDVEETALNLTLKGVILSSIAENSEAVIGHGREEKFYTVGTKLPGGNNVKLVQVQADQVILENNGRNEALRLFEPNDSVSSAPAPSRSRNLSLGNINRNPREIFEEELARAGVDPNDLNNEDEEPTPKNRRVVSQVPKSLAEVIKFSVAREGGEIVGYKIRPGRNRDAFSQLGLQPNDIVTEINGIALNNSGSVSQVYREMREATSASITLLRDGQSQSLNITLEDNSEE